MSRAGSARPAVSTRRDRGDPVITTVDALTQDGRGVCRIDGKAVFVADALPGETVSIQPTRRRKGHDEARLLEVVQPSAQRRAPRCEYFGYCGGCALQHLEHAAQLAAKQDQLLSALARIGKVEPAAVSAAVRGECWGYRRRARLGVRWVRAKNRVLVGFRERSASFIADMQHCEVLSPGCRDLPGELATLIEGLSIRTRLPQVEVTVADNAVALVFRVLEPPDNADLAALRAFAESHDYRLYLQPGGLDSVVQLTGDADPLYYRLDGGRLRVEFEPTDFIQVNAEVNEKMVAAAMAALDIKAGDSLLDLFCGLGNFSLPAARRGARVMGVEGEAALVARARANAASNGLGDAQFAIGNLFNDCGDFPWARQQYDQVLLDPPRAGARAIVERIDVFAPRRIVYVSCHPGTLARDAELLCARGYSLSLAGILDMFPHTAHVESMAVFDRS